MISDKTCLDLKDGAMHVQRRRTCVVHGAYKGTNTEAEFEISCCPNKLELRGSYDKNSKVTLMKEDVYRVTSSDNDIGLSIEDQSFIEIMEMPLWFCSHNISIANNRSYAAKCLKKPDQIEVLFDSSAECQGVSLNQQLLRGPEFMNSLVGVLSCFCRENIAAMCDVEQMFHSFHVDPKHRNFLCFLWLKDNTSQHIVEYKMTVHLFGNGPSPAVATYGQGATTILTSTCPMDECDFSFACPI